MKTLLLGMGNPFLSDDAVGIRLARDFRSALAGVPDLEIIEECPVGGLGLLEILPGYDCIIVLDAIQTPGGVAGTWHSFGPEALCDTLHLGSLHDLNFASAIELGRLIGIPLPHAIHIFAVEVQEIRTFSERMSAALEADYPRYSAEILSSVRALLGSR